MKTRQKGFTLVELMVAMIVGLILTLAALQLFLTSQRTFALQQALAELHEDGQIVTRYLTADMRQAGRGNAISGAIPPVKLENTTDGSNDAVSIHYWGTSTCAGEEYPAETEIENTYSVNNGILQCRSELTGTTVQLVSGVDSFQVLYGIDDEKDDALGVTNFVTADQLDDDSVIVAIRFALLLSNDQFNQVAASSNTYWVLNEPSTHNDNILRRVYSATVQLRNYNWDDV